MLFPLSKIGHVISGDAEYPYVRIEPIDSSYLILFSEDPAMSPSVMGCDDWVPDYDTLLAYFAEADLVVDWDFDQRSLVGWAVPTNFLS